MWNVLLLCAAAGWRGPEAGAAPDRPCTDTPGWANNCSAKHPPCSMKQFPYGHNPGLFNASGPTPGWTCSMYGDSRTGWCSGGVLKIPSTGGTNFNHPQDNCCVCGKGRPQPTPAPAPTPHPARELDVCGGACQSGMVLQRSGARLWGLDGQAGETVTVAVDGHEQRSGRAGVDGRWSVDLSLTASWNRTVTITGSSGRATVLQDINFGDVLLCSGQSNMELVTSDSISVAASSGIRVLRLDHFSSPNKTIDTVRWHHSWDGSGTTCTDRCGAPWAVLSTQKQFSAVCRITGASLFDSLGGKVPIGLVESAWGGTRIESWSSPDALAACPVDTTAGCGPPLLGPNEWARMNSSNSGNLCSAAYNGMLHPILPMRFLAMLWYQGESNIDGFQGQWAGSRSYACRSRAAVLDWRSKFEDQPNLPVFYVELAACNNYDDAQVLFPPLRQAQRAVLSLPHTGFITALDVGIGGGVHSPIKRPDGERMALQIRAKVYAETGLQADGPALAAPPTVSFTSAAGTGAGAGGATAGGGGGAGVGGGGGAAAAAAARVIESAGFVSLRFANASGLHASTVHSPTGGCACGSITCSPFEVGWSNGSWVQVSFTIDTATATVTLPLPSIAAASPAVTEVRYAWIGYPQCALYSGAAGTGWNDTSAGALPAAPFRVAVASGCSATTQTRCEVFESAQCCMNSDVEPYLPGGEICTPNGGGCQCRGCNGSVTPQFPPPILKASYRVALV